MRTREKMASFTSFGAKKEAKLHFLPIFASRIENSSMATHKNTFPLAEHIKSKSLIERLYTTGTSVLVFPLRAVYITLGSEEQAPAATVTISVAKKRFRHAVDRNLVKRRIREAYRLNKHLLFDALDAHGKKMAMAIIYIDTKHNSTDFLKSKMKRLLYSIMEKENLK